jgi:hypothetical protein
MKWNTYVNRRCNFRRQKCGQEAEKILKYVDLTTETACTECKNKTGTSNNRGNWYHSKIIPRIPQDTRIPGKHKFTELQKTATLGTAHTVREVLM